MKHFEEREDPLTGERYLLVWKRGIDLMADPYLNKGTCFTLEERDALGLEGLLPPGVATPAQQEARCFENYRHGREDVDRYLFLLSLHDRNETLFYRMLREHVEEMVPIVYTPTVGRVCQLYSHIYRRPRGVYISRNDRGRMKEILANAPVQDCRIVVVTDNEAILGLGDLGVGGMGIPIGKLSLYTAGAGIHPASCLPIDLDVGTENESLLDDPLYLGSRHRRLRGEEYFELLDELVDALKALYPRACVQWEDFANDNAFAILDRYRERILSFNDDIQGTSAVVLAGILGASHQAGRALKEERTVFLGCGAAGGGCARMLRTALIEEGLAEREAREHVLCLDSKGLIVADRSGLPPHKKNLACERAFVQGWSGGENGTFGLLDVVRNFRPTTLVGTSGRAGAFTNEIVHALLEGCGRPAVLPLSNPTTSAEATPADVLRWTDGAAIVATGSPFPPVDHAGRRHVIGQANNVLVFPGVGMGAIASGARHLPAATFLAVARALFKASQPSTVPGTPLFPGLGSLRRVSLAVAQAVATSLVETGAAPPMEPDEIAESIAAHTWDPAYLSYRPAGD